MFQIHPAHGLRDSLRFVVFEREWLRRCHRAKSASARATIASDHESSGALAPAFPTIRTLRALANRVQPQIGNQRFSRKENRIRWQPHFYPRRFLRLMQDWINLRAGHSKKVTTLKTLQKSNRCASPLRMPSRTIVAHAVAQFRFAGRRHSPYDFWHDSNPVASGF